MHRVIDIIRSYRRSLAAKRNVEERFFELAKKYEGCGVLVQDDRDAGFFSIYLQVLCSLRIADLYGLEITLNCGVAPYTDPKLGNDYWWGEYFENSERMDGCGSEEDLQKKKEGGVCKIDDDELKVFANTALAFERKIAHRYVRELRVKDHVQRFIDEEKSKWPNNKIIIGVHYRGTDKVRGEFKESVLISYHWIIESLIKMQEKIPVAIFIATDEIPFLNAMKKHFGKSVYYIPATRSSDDQPVHLNPNRVSPYHLGLEALVDSVLLSEVDFLIRSDSNLSHASLFMNPKLEFLNLSELERSNEQDVVKIQRVLNAILKSKRIRRRLRKLR